MDYLLAESAIYATAFLMAGVPLALWIIHEEQ